MVAAVRRRSCLWSVVVREGSSMVFSLRSFMPLAAAAAGVAAAGVAAVGAAPPPDAGLVTIAVAGRSNANVSIAARDTLVVAAWGASRDGAADIYAAVSRDGGRSFGAPVRINATAGEAAIGGERAPRVAIASRTGGPAIAVLWTAKAPAARADRAAGVPAPGPVIRLAESIDLGRTFAAPIDLSSRNVPGIRGWAALAAGADGAWYAAWLDGRAEAAKKAAAASAAPPAAGATAGSGHHHHGGSTGTGPLQEVFYRVVGGTPQAAEALGATGVCFCCKTAILGPAAASGSLGARGMVLAWRHIFPNSERDIAMSVLDPAAGRPGRMMRVSDDHWQLQGCPDDGPGLAASGSGTIHVVWPTLADATAASSGPEKAIYHARTTDGRTFTPRRRLDKPGSGAAHPVVGALASGSAVALWDEVADGTRRVVLQPIREPAAPQILGPGTYPAVAAVDDAFVVAWTAGSGDAAVVRVQRVNP
jgi:hypothetical protein